MLIKYLFCLPILPLVAKEGKKGGKELRSDFFRNKFKNMGSSWNDNWPQKITFFCLICLEGICVIPFNIGISDLIHKEFWSNQKMYIGSPGLCYDFFLKWSISVFVTDIFTLFDLLLHKTDSSFEGKIEKL